MKDPRVGRPITNPQLELLTLPGLISHLTSAFHHLLALSISSALSLRTEPVRLLPGMRLCVAMWHVHLWSADQGLRV